MSSQSSSLPSCTHIVHVLPLNMHNHGKSLTALVPKNITIKKKKKKVEWWMHQAMMSKVGLILTSTKKFQIQYINETNEIIVRHQRIK